METNLSSPVERAIARVSGGNITKFAEAVGVKRQLVCFWKKQGNFTASRLGELSKKTGIPIRELAPDDWEWGDAES